MEPSEKLWLLMISVMRLFIFSKAFMFQSIVASFEPQFRYMLSQNRFLFKGCITAWITHINPSISNPIGDMISISLLSDKNHSKSLKDAIGCGFEKIKFKFY
jgi:hypothetical protein